MKKLYWAMPVLMSLAVQANAFETIARAVNVVPITETVNRPGQHGWTETRQMQQEPRHDPGRAILGTIAGGILGSEIGKGNGRVAAAAVGAGIGAVTGDRIANGDAQVTTTTLPVQRCESVDNLEMRVAAYRVTYEYDTYRFTTRLPYYPGNEMRVNVAVTLK